jgi:hypothetical protein
MHSSSNILRCRVKIFSGAGFRPHNQTVRRMGLSPQKSHDQNCISTTKTTRRAYTSGMTIITPTRTPDPTQPNAHGGLKILNQRVTEISLFVNGTNSQYVWMYNDHLLFVQTPSEIISSLSWRISSLYWRSPVQIILFNCF